MSVELDDGGAVGRLGDVDEGAVANDELAGSIKDVMTSTIAGCAVNEGTEEFVVCWKLSVVAATVVDNSKAEDIEVSW